MPNPSEQAAKSAEKEPIHPTNVNDLEEIGVQ
jgi:hypothetical protein